MKPVKTEISWPTIVVRGILFSLIWWILSAGAVSSWWIGAPAVLLAVTVSALLLPPVPLVWYELLRFVPFFLKHSLLGGIDVAWRAFHPSMPIDPDFIDYPLRLPPGIPQVFMTNTVSLWPGTLSAELGVNGLRIHALDRRKDCVAELDAVERSVARIFGISLNAP